MCAGNQGAGLNLNTFIKNQNTIQNASVSACCCIAQHHPHSAAFKLIGNRMPPQILLQQALYVSSAVMALAMQHTMLSGHNGRPQS